MVYLRPDMDAAIDSDPNPLLAGAVPPDFGAIDARHIRPAVAEVLAAERARLAQLAAVDTPTREWLGATERLLERVHDVWNPISHLNSVASNPALREAYNECLAEVTAFFSDLGLNEALFSRFEALAGSIDSEPEAELIRQSLRDFRLAGVALEGEARAAYRAVSLELAAKQAAFEQNLMDATDAFEHHETDAARLGGLPEQVLERARGAAADRNLDGWLLKLDSPTYQSVMTHADDAGLRELYYRAWVTRASADSGSEWDNSPLIEDILRLRQRSAELLGFDNYAALSLARKMAESESRVLEFLDDLAARSREYADAEFAELERFAGRPVAAHDVAYYSEKLKQATLDIGDEELRAYFPVPRVLAGLFGLAERLFGIRLEEIDGLDLWHDTARAFAITNLDGTPVGTLLTDFYARPNKRGGAWMDVCANRSRLGTLERDPIAHLVCNFAPSSSNAPSYITHNDVVTLFHEFGHSLHHLLTEIDYPSIAGINGVAWDAVELPSQFFENYAWHPDVLRSVSAHRTTGAVIPDDKIETLISSRTFLSGLAMVRQLEFALFDFRLHARSEPASRDEVQALIDEVRSRVGVVPTPAYNRFQCSFAHIFAGGYAAGYYSYKWAEVLAADAFAAFDEPGAFDAETAERFRRAILAVGGSRDAMESFIAFRGRSPELDALLRQAGMIH
jgi:oligopeptidase A